MSKIIKYLLQFLNLLDSFFRESIFNMYIFLILIVVYVMYEVFINNMKISEFTSNRKLFKQLFYVMTIYHFILKIIISLYLIVKFNPYLKIRYKGKNDKKIIYNCALLLFTSTIIIDPIIQTVQRIINK